jgi:hypothetical protein
VARRNIVVAPTGKAAKAYIKGKEKGFEFVDIDRNLYWAGGEDVRFSVGHQDKAGDIIGLKEWRQAGYDRRSMVEDPLFVDAGQNDYRLRPKSPARKLGIVSVDVSEAGLYGESFWVELPDKVDLREPDAETPISFDKALHVDEDYEDKAVGYVPNYVQGTNRNKGGVVEVTAEQAADGSKCLKFVDVPGLERSYYPNRVWRDILFAEGRVRVSLDFMNSRKEPASFRMEMRDWTGGSFKRAVNLVFRPEGYLEIAGSGRRFSYEPGSWYHLEIEFAVGGKSSGRYELSFAEKGEAGEAVQPAFVNDEFETLSWLGLMAIGSERNSKCFIDNFKVEME